jgi:hypothetical protein
MNFDYRGTLVSKSTPTPELRTIKKVLHVDSSDRDVGIYYTNGEFVVYLPRVYEKVVSLRLMSAEFPSLDAAWTHSYTNGNNLPTATFSSDTNVGVTSSSNYTPNYFLVEIDGLNKADEAAVGANKSQYPDSFYAKIANVVSQKSTSTAGLATAIIEYNDHSGMENIARFNPPIGKMDRMRIRTRLHSQQGSQGFIYWTLSNASTATATASNTNVANFCLTFEIEYLDNGFDKFSSMQTRLGPGDRAGSP